MRAGILLFPPPPSALTLLFPHSSANNHGFRRDCKEKNSRSSSGGSFHATTVDLLPSSPVLTTTISDKHHPAAVTVLSFPQLRYRTTIVAPVHHATVGAPIPADCSSFFFLHFDLQGRDNLVEYAPVLSVLVSCCFSVAGSFGLS